MPVDNPYLGLRCVRYLRLSRNRTGRIEGTSIARQDVDTAKMVADHGLIEVTAEPLVDNDRSAGEGKRRESYEALLDLVASGAIDCVVAYDQSRITRSSHDLQGLLFMARRAGVRLIFVADIDCDPNDPTDKLVTGMLGLVTEMERDFMSRRQRARHRHMAEAGAWVGGRRSFGYELEKDAQGASLKRLAVVPLEADAIRTGVTSILGGGSTGRVARAWNEAGLRTPSGNLWNTRMVGQTLKAPRLAGLRVHQPDPDEPPVTTLGQWEPIITPDEHERIVALMAARKRGPRPGRKPAYLGTGGILTCGRCGHNLNGGSNCGKRAYKCPPPATDANACGHISIEQGRAERELVTWLVNYVSDPDLTRRVAERAGAEADLGRINAQVLALRGRIAEAWDLAKADRLSMTEYVDLRDALEGEVADLRKEISRRSTDAALGELVGLDADAIVALFTDDEASTLDERRYFLERCIASAVVQPVRRGNRTGDRIVITGRV